MGQHSSNTSYFYFANTLSPVHSGGAGGNYIADFAIQREVKEQIPKIDSSTWKGSARRVIQEKKDLSNNWMFSDLKLLFFPIRSSKNTFLLVTSSDILREMKMILKTCPINNKEECLEDLDLLIEEADYLMDGQISCCFEDKNILLGQYPYEVEKVEEEVGQAMERLANRIGQSVKRLALIPHKELIDIVFYETEYVTRVKLGDDRVIEDKGLFVEEYLPEEAILYGTVSYFYNILKSDEENKKILSNIKMPEKVQIGKNSTLEKGLVQLRRWE